MYLNFPRNEIVTGKKREAFTVTRVETTIGIIFCASKTAFTQCKITNKEKNKNYHMQDIKGQLNLVSAGSKKKTKTLRLYIKIISTRVLDYCMEQYAVK